MKTLLHTLRRAIAPPAAAGDQQHVHFHRGPAGHPAPCYDAECPIPRLDV